MSYFHVLLSFQDTPGILRCVLSDLSERELMAKFVAPYRSGRNILCGNEVIDVGRISKVTVIRTLASSAVELAKIQEKSRKEIDEINRSSAVFLVSPGRGYDLEDIVEAGSDVTAEYIVGPPGYGNQWTPVASVLNHQWVVAVGTGLLVAALVWWFGWN